MQETLDKVYALISGAEKIAASCRTEEADSVKEILRYAMNVLFEAQEQIS